MYSKLCDMQLEFVSRPLSSSILVRLLQYYYTCSATDTVSSHIYLKNQNNKRHHHEDSMDVNAVYRTIFRLV